MSFANRSVPFSKEFRRPLSPKKKERRIVPPSRWELFGGWGEITPGGQVCLGHNLDPTPFSCFLGFRGWGGGIQGIAFRTPVGGGSSVQL